MKAKVTELQQVFVDRVEAGEFEFIEVSAIGVAKIQIDGYIFTFIKVCDKIKQALFDNLMQLPEINNSTYLIEAIDNHIKQAKIEALNKLQQEIQEL